MESLPLFPLGQPLFPGVPLKLQIFEQRYLRLMKNTLRSQQPFGVVPILSGREVGNTPDIYLWGTCVTIRDWDQLDNGLLCITVQGEQRLHVSTFEVQHDGLMVSESSLYAEDIHEPVHEDDGDLVQLLIKLATRVKLPDLLPDKNVSVSVLGWRLLQLLPFDDAWRLALFEEDDPELRLQAIRTHLLALSQG